jgi:hypothetical protein
MIIGLLGFAGSGKSTVGDYLVQNHGYEQYAFADSLKDAVSVIFNWDRALLEGDTKPSRAFRENVDDFWSARLGRRITPRMILQQVGTDAMRNVIDQNIWVHSLESKITGKDNVVITDVRFPNEIDCIQRLGGKLIRIQRGPNPVWYETAYNHNMLGVHDMPQKYPGIHVSEWAWIGHKPDATIHNDGNKQTLGTLIEKCLQVMPV